MLTSTFNLCHLTKICIIFVVMENNVQTNKAELKENGMNKEPFFELFVFPSHFGLLRFLPHSLPHWKTEIGHKESADLQEPVIGTTGCKTSSFSRWLFLNKVHFESSPMTQPRCQSEGERKTKRKSIS